MKIAIISPKNRTTYNFRGDLIREIIRRKHTVIATGPNKIDVENVINLGVDFVEIPMKKNGVNVASDLIYFFRLFRFFKIHKPDVVLGYTIKPVVYGSIAAKIAGVKNINSMITGAGYVFISKTKKAKLVKIIVNFLYKLGLACSNNVIFQNSDDLDEFVKNKLVKKEKCSIVNGSGVNMERFSPAQLPEKTTFFMLSRVMFSKGIREYLEAAKKVKEIHPEVVFILLGACENIQDSISREELQPYIDNGIIEYYGETPDVRGFYKKCSVYVLPSYREGTPRTVLEAMATKRPIITTDAPGCRETVIDGENGFLVKAKDVDSLYKKMLYFIDNPNIITEMGQKSLEYCKEKFDVEKVNNNLLNIMKVEENKYELI